MREVVASIKSDSFSLFTLLQRRKDMKRTIFTVFLMIMIITGAGSVTAFAKTYSANFDKSYTLTGKIQKHKVCYDEIHMYTAYDLVLSKKVKVKTYDGQVAKTKRLMIVTSDLSKSAKRKVIKLAGKNKKIKVTGKICEGETAWYCEDYAIWATQIKQVK